MINQLLVLVTANGTIPIQSKNFLSLLKLIPLWVTYAAKIAIIVPRALKYQPQK